MKLMNNPNIKCGYQVQKLKRSRGDKNFQKNKQEESLMMKINIIKKLLKGSQDD